MSGGHEWASVYVEFTGTTYGPSSDEVVLGMCVPAARRSLESFGAHSYFFVRYREELAQVRLRVSGPPQIGQQLEALLHEEAASSKVADRIGPVSIRSVPYEPEVERYGGEEGVRAAERFFHASSEVAAELTRDCPAEGSQRSGRAVMALAVILHGFIGKPVGATEFLTHYRSRYLAHFLESEGHVAGWEDAFEDSFARQSEAMKPFVVEAWNRLDEGAPLSPALDRYRDAVSVLKEELLELVAKGALSGSGVHNWEDVVAKLLSSYVHMTNNRLGVSTAAETYLAHLLARSLESTMQHEAVT